MLSDMRLILFSFLILSFLPFHALAKKRRYSKRTMSVSFVNAYTFYSGKDSPNAFGPKDAARLIEGDGQMNSIFSALELARNFGRSELGVRIQNISTSFVSPFVKVNFIKNYSNSFVVPSLTVGLVPSGLFGAWSRASLSFYVHHYCTLEPFIGFYGWYKITDELAGYEKSNYHFNSGLRINIYF